VQCQSNLKQWGLAFRFYAEDQNGWLPPTGVYTASKKSFQYFWCDKPLKKYVKRTASNVDQLLIFTCKAGVNPVGTSPEVEKWISNKKTVGRYGMNSMIRVDLYPYGATEGKPMTAIINTSKTMLVIDCLYYFGDEWDFWIGYPTPFGNAPHNNGSNALMCDGHVIWKDVKNLKALSGSDRYNFWYGKPDGKGL